jgi:ATP-dependent DNA ligase
LRGALPQVTTPARFSFVTDAVEAFHGGYIPFVSTLRVVGGFRLLVSNALPGSLLLGAYDGDELRLVATVNGFTEDERFALMSAMRPYVTELDGHPWEHEDIEQPWVPLRPELVCEVTDGGAPRFVRWRPDARLVSTLRR